MRCIFWASPSPCCDGSLVPLSVGSSEVWAGAESPGSSVAPLKAHLRCFICLSQLLEVRGQKCPLGLVGWILSPDLLNKVGSPQGCGFGSRFSWSSTPHGEKGQGQGKGTLTCISANTALSWSLKQITLLKCELLLPDFCAGNREKWNLPTIAVLRKGPHLAAFYLIQQAKCGFKSQSYPCLWPEGCRQWLGLFASMFIKGLISNIRLNFTLGIFSTGFLAKLILLSNKYLQF